MDLQVGTITELSVPVIVSAFREHSTYTSEGKKGQLREERQSEEGRRLIRLGESFHTPSHWFSSTHIIIYSKT